MSLEKDYSQQISKVFQEFHGIFPALASPTLSKQETATSLYHSINEGIKREQSTPRFPWYRLFQFIPRLLLMFTRIGYVSLRFRVRSIPEDSVVFKTWLVPRSFTGIELKDEYFRQLPKEISENEKVIISNNFFSISL